MQYLPISRVFNWKLYNLLLILNCQIKHNFYEKFYNIIIINIIINIITVLCNKNMIIIDTGMGVKI